MSLTNDEILIQGLSQARNKAHGELNQLLTSALRTTLPSDDEDMNLASTFNSKCQVLVQEIKDYSERLGQLTK